jgi:CubicO group peptidase (beta-lactamase class C family)
MRLWIARSLASATFVLGAPEIAAQTARGTEGSRAVVVRPALDATLLDSAYRRAATLPRLRSLLVARDGRLVRERYFRGATRDRPANIKSASKSIVSALVGIAIAQQRIGSVRQPITPYFRNELADPSQAGKRSITIEDLLTMRSGLETTSFYNYGRWVTSRDWVRFALSQPLVAEPGTEMIYSTGSSHLVSAILTRATGMSTWEFANRHLAQPLGIAIPRWQRDPQGIYFGGNDMYLTPRAMLAFGNLYLRRGRSADGKQVVPARWIDSSFVRRTYSGWSGNEYGYGWWSRRLGGHETHFAWGYGGQFIFVVPGVGVTAVVTSDPEARSREGDHLAAIYDIMDRYVIPAARTR